MKVEQPAVNGCNLVRTSLPSPPQSAGAQRFFVTVGEDRFLIYAPLKGLAFIGNGPLVRAIQRQQQFHDAELPDREDGHRQRRTAAADPRLDFLEQLDFFTADPEPAMPQLGNEPEYESVVLFLTNRCNLRCVYCYAGSGDGPSCDMSWPMAQAAVDHVLELARRRPNPALLVGFHGGGEPVLNWDVFRRTVEYARRISRLQHVEVFLSCASNGIWTADQTRFIVEHLDQVNISFDGLPMVQNQQRPAGDGHPTAGAVCRTIRSLDEAKADYAIRLTVTRDSVTSLAESVRFICDRFRPSTLQVEPVYALGRGARLPSAIADPVLFIEQFIQADRIAEAAGVRFFYSGARPDTITNRFCMAPLQALVVTPQGYVTTCFEALDPECPRQGHFIVGAYESAAGFHLDLARWRDIAADTAHLPPQCTTCFCRWHCAGDCRGVRMWEHSTTAETDRCRINKELTKYLILKKINESGGWIWRRGGIPVEEVMPEASPPSAAKKGSRHHLYVRRDRGWVKINTIHRASSCNDNTKTGRNPPLKSIRSMMSIWNGIRTGVVS
ncbi:MAG: radical SAM protein [Acidobacteria bacterium]|nr:radical SAM protein [Acidobacteriota bacterium]